METKVTGNPIEGTRDKPYNSILPSGAPRIGGGTGGILTRLFNLLCYDVTAGNGISAIRWNDLMNDYIRTTSDNNTSLDRSSIRGNTNKQLHKTSMTWNVLFKGIQFLKFEAFTIGICGEIESGKEFNAYTSVSFKKHTQFESLFPKELPAGHAVVSRSVLKGTRGKRVFSNEPGGVLAKLFSLICLDLTDQQGYSQQQWTDMVTEWGEINLSGASKMKLLNDKSNTNKEFRYPKITWRVFCKGLKFIKTKRFTLYITCYREDGLISNCETSINFAPSK